LPVLKRELDPETVIITVDDDVVYHPQTISALVYTILKHPNHAATFVCEEPGWFGGVHQKSRSGECHGWLCAYAGGAYRRRFFNDSVFEYKNVHEGCRLHDDVYLSGMALREMGVRPWVVQADFKSVVSHRPYNRLSIHTVADGESKHRDPCIASFNYFK
jgi:hypothetical protein